MSAWDWVAVGVVAWLTLCGLTTVLASRWAQHMATKNQLIQLDRELDQQVRENAA